ncbi:MAG: GAF domain-containing protein [Gemmatimonadetes bacterium]|nr:GAF domain-containing protein [Gemmatimonadota bacterium]
MSKPSTIEEFPFGTRLSLVHLIEFWERQDEDPSSLHAPLARVIVEKLDEAPELRGIIDDPSLLDTHRDLVDLMMTAMVPAGRREDYYVLAGEPFKTLGHSFYETPAWRGLGLGQADGSKPQLNLGPEQFAFGKLMWAYEFVLEEWVGVEANLQPGLVMTIHDEEVGLDRHFSLDVDSRFTSVRLVRDIDKPSPEDVARLLAEPTNIELWTEMLPPDAFEFDGMTVITAVDITPHEVISRLKNDLIEKDSMASPEKIDRLQHRIRNLLGCPELSLGLIAFDRRADVEAIEGARAVGKSLLLCDECAPACPNRANSYYAGVFESKDPVIVQDLKKSELRTGYEHHLRKHGHRSLLLYPLHVDDQLVGLMELASPRPGDLNAFNARRLVDVVPLFATTLKRNLDELEDHVQALIKRKYTAIHPSVEWRFREAALRYLEEKERGEVSPELEQIVFHDVYPLYGLVDMRDSSRIRNEAIGADLGEQLQMALDVINAAGQIRPLPALEEVGYRLAQRIERIESELRSDDESGVLELLRRDVEPLFGQLETYGSEVAERVAAYREALDADLNIVYRRRKDFEESVAGLNDAISMTLDAEEERAQAMFPHFFEKFRTDGVDHSIYVGAELHEDGLFDELYLRNLRIWQLMTTCRIEWELARVKPDMAVSLEATHLILVQHQPLSIRFRIDEKRFDVDGAYDIRYEIVKKRIDKARIRGTSERVTQPGQLAIVYSTASEGAEYTRYIEFLQGKGYFGPGLEELELEDLPGISGLKALRVTIASRNETDEATPPARPSASEIEAVLSGDQA